MTNRNVDENVSMTRKWLFLIVLVVTGVGLILLTAAGVRAAEQKLWIDPTADFSPAISEWPAEVVPIYPGAEPMKCSRAGDPNCGPNPGIHPHPSADREINVGYVLNIRGASGREIEQWYDKQFLANRWVLTQPESGRALPRYDKCWSPSGVVSASFQAMPMGEYSGAPILLTLMLDKYASGQQGAWRCGETVQDSFSGSSGADSTGHPPEGATGLCALSGEQTAEAARLKSEIQTGFGVDICESDLCRSNIRAPLRESVSPWSSSSLDIVQATLHLLNKSCFLKTTGLESICKSGSQEREMCSGSTSAYASPADHKVVLCYDRWGIKDQKKTANEFYGEGTALLQQLLVHEIGHVYWRNQDGSLNFDKVSNWLLGAGYLDCTTMLGCLGVVGGGFATPPPDAPSEYAATGPAEDFAESVRFYVTQPDKLRERSLSRYRYLKDDVFCGYEYGGETGRNNNGPN